MHVVLYNCHMSLHAESRPGIQARMEAQALPRSLEQRSGFPDFDTLIKADTEFWNKFTGVPAAEKVLSPDVQSKYYDTARKLETVGGADHWKAVYVPHEIRFSTRSEHPGQSESPPEIAHLAKSRNSLTVEKGIYFVDTTPQMLDQDGKPYYKDDPLGTLCEETRNEFPQLHEQEIDKKSRFGLIMDPLDYIFLAMMVEQKVDASTSAEPITWLTAFALSHRVPELRSNIMPEMYSSSWAMGPGEIMRGQDTELAPNKILTLRNVPTEQIGFRLILHLPI